MRSLHPRCYIITSSNISSPPIISLLIFLITVISWDTRCNTDMNVILRYLRDILSIIIWQIPLPWSVAMKLLTSNHHLLLLDKTRNELSMTIEIRNLKALITHLQYLDYHEVLILRIKSLRIFWAFVVFYFDMNPGNYFEK